MKNSSRNRLSADTFSGFISFKVSKNEADIKYVVFKT